MRLIWTETLSLKLSNKTQNLVKIVRKATLTKLTHQNLLEVSHLSSVATEQVRMQPPNDKINKNFTLFSVKKKSFANGFPQNEHRFQR